jgi:hypothetical protein
MVEEHWGPNFRITQKLVNPLLHLPSYFLFGIPTVGPPVENPAKRKFGLQRLWQTCRAGEPTALF